jgi:FemAB-related protein (PEP-CTERM system-associated)
VNAPPSIGILINEEEPAWDAFVASCQNTSVYHQSAWRHMITALFGHETYYLRAISTRGGIVGILPLVRLRSRLFGDYLVSMPYFNYGGAIAVSTEIETALMKNACTLASDLGSTHIEFRDTVKRNGDWTLWTNKVVMELALPESTEALWARLGSKLRAQIKRPSKADVEVDIGGRDLLPQFYSVFCRNMRDLGTPVYPTAFFASILDVFPKSAFLTVVHLAGKPVAAGFLLGFKDRLEIPWASSLRKHNRLGVNMLLYWEALKSAIDKGYRIFDFGRSTRNSSTYRFKLQWHPTERQLYWYYWLRSGETMPDLTPDNPKYRLAVRLWRELPLAVTNFLGPRIVKNLP